MQMIEQSFEHEDPNWAATWLDNLRQERAIAVIRSPSLSLGSRMATAVAAGPLVAASRGTSTAASAARVAGRLAAGVPGVLLDGPGVGSTGGSAGGG